MSTARVLVAAGGVLVVALLAWPQPAPAANANKPRVPAIWTPGACISTVDVSQTPVLHLEYTIATEETYDLTDDEVEDSRRHQFFAFAAQRYELTPPIWITQADIDRAALVDASVEPASISPEDVLETTTRWKADEWVRITADDARVVITVEQAMMGVDWDLTNVHPGTWLVKSYTWEPLNNLWSTRWSAVKVVETMDAIADAGPSVILLPENAVLMSGVEYVPSGCIDAPPGSTLTIEYGVVEGTLEPEWEVAVDEAKVENGAFSTPIVLDACVDGEIDLRATITDPSGKTYVAYSPGFLSASPSEGDTCDRDDGCGCAAGTGSAPWLLLAVVPVLRRRRGRATLRS
jgi:uncharacterized protein (TIGR03382 family)